MNQRCLDIARGGIITTLVTDLCYWLVYVYVVIYRDDRGQGGVYPGADMRLGTMPRSLFSSS